MTDSQNQTAKTASKPETTNVVAVPVALFICVPVEIDAEIPVDENARTEKGLPVVSVDMGDTAIIKAVEAARRSPEIAEVLSTFNAVAQVHRRRYPTTRIFHTPFFGLSEDVELCPPKVIEDGER